MGVENYLEQYPKDEELRLSDLALENPEKEDFELDPEKEIPEDIWEEIKKSLEKRLKNKRYNDFLLKK